MAKYSLFAILNCALALSVLVLAQDQKGFISIDCGITEGSSYEDETTGISYTSDKSYIDTGENRPISPEYKAYTSVRQLWNLRIFPNGTRNCYTLRPEEGKGKKYLIRAWFMYGNYDNQEKAPVFDLYIGTDLWHTVITESSYQITRREIIHVSLNDYIHICLVNTGFGTPFISALELRLLKKNNTYVAPGSLSLFARIDFGLPFGKVVRYKDDIYDRMWGPLGSFDAEYLNSSQSINSVNQNDYEPPSIVMTTALIPNVGSEVMGFQWGSGNSTSRYFVYMHFAELLDLQPKQIREFNIYMNEDLWYGPLQPSYLTTTTIYSTLGTVPPVGAKVVKVMINKTERSILPPLINALEIYTLLKLSQLQTHQNDIDAILSIKSMYGIKKNWQGDPCYPETFSWNSLNCSYGNNQSRIISLDLSSSGLTGEIAPYISSLTYIQILDLSNNNLNGTIPSFLSHLQFLKILNLERNNISGTIPQELLQKTENGTLILSVGQNPNLCASDTCETKKAEENKKKNKFLIPVIASAGVLVIIMIISIAVACIFCRRRRRQQEPVAGVQMFEVDQNGMPRGQQYARG